MKRFVEEELLDLDTGTPREVQASLDDLRNINRMLGGNTLHKRLFAQAAAGTSGPLRVLEVAAGRADVLQAALLPLQKQGRALTISLLDVRPDHLPRPEHWNPSLPKPELFAGNALHLPFADDSFDILSCSLFLHHLEPEQIQQFLKEAFRVTRTAVVVNDPERRRANWLFAKLGFLVFRSRITSYDALVSIRRAYTLQEMRSVLEKSGYRFQLRRYPLFRLGAIVWKH